MEIIASNGYIGIMEIIYGINDYVKHTNSRKASMLRYNSKGDPYFISDVFDAKINYIIE